jgi:hypothetical protein
MNIPDGTQNGRDSSDGVDQEVLEPIQVFQNLGTDGIAELVCIYSALYPIHVHCCLDVGSNTK